MKKRACKKSKNMEKEDYKVIIPFVNYTKYTESDQKLIHAILEYVLYWENDLEIKKGLIIVMTEIIEQYG